MGRYVKNPQATQGQTLEIPSVTTANRPAGQNGQIIFNLTRKMPPPLPSLQHQINLQHQKSL